jgi:hypothetical protein
MCNICAECENFEPFYEEYYVEDELCLDLGDGICKITREEICSPYKENNCESFIKN